MFNFARQTLGGKKMLGMDSKETPVVRGQYATEVREALKRVVLRQPNDSDLQIEKRSKSIRTKYETVWK